MRELAGAAPDRPQRGLMQGHVLRLCQSLQQRAVVVVKPQIHGHDQMVPKWYYIKSCCYPALALIGMSACLQLRPGVACASPLVLAVRFPGMPAAGWGGVCDVCPRKLTAVLGRPPGANALPLPAKACPAPCSLGHEQFRDLTSCARLSPEPSGRDLAKVALADLATSRPETVSPHQGLWRLSDFF